MNNAYLMKWLVEIRASYWFVPSVMVVGAILLSILTLWIDGQVSSEWPRELPFIFASRPSGARSLLATVAGSMITVAGVTFSLTLLAVSHASAQFGPRILNNFMRDRANQLTLGTFIATFMYCLMVLRTVRSAGETEKNVPNGSELAESFVPQFSITVALTLALCSIGVLIYFFHHMPESIRLSNVVSKVGKDLQRSINSLFPETVAGDQPSELESPPTKQVPEGFFKNAKAITLDQSGYVQTIDEQGVMNLANKHDLVIFLNCKPGDFYCSSTELMYAWPGSKVTDEIAQQLKVCYALGIHRTEMQNALFAVDQLVEVAQRALSPGVNDPITANYCIDWLQSVLVSMTQRSRPEVFRYNQSNKLRIFTRPVAFEDFCNRVFDQLRQYVASDFNASIHMITSINAIRRAAKDPDHICILNAHAAKLIKTAEQQQLTSFDITHLKRLNQMGIDRLESPYPSLEDIFNTASASLRGT